MARAAPLLLLVGIFIAFQLLLFVAELVLGPFGLPGWAPLVLVLIALVAEVCWLTGRPRRRWVLPAEFLAFAATGIACATPMLPA